MSCGPDNRQRDIFVALARSKVVSLSGSTRAGTTALLRAAKAPRLPLRLSEL